MNKIFLTYDYELPSFMREGDVNEILVKKTERLLEVLNEFRIKCTFFIDPFFILKISEEKKRNHELMKVYDKVKENIEQIINDDHDVQFHPHPEWMYAKYNMGCWITKPEKDIFYVQSNTNYSVDAIFTEGIYYINQICSKKPIAYRAPGLTLFPFNDSLKKAFISNKIIVDSSVAPKLVFKSSFSSVNYSKIGTNYDCWYFNCFPLKKETNRGFIELPIYTVPIKKINSLLFYKKARSLETGFTTSLFLKKSKINSLIRNTQTIASCVKTNYYCYDFNLDKNSIERFIPDKDMSNKCYTLLSHPKTMNAMYFSNLRNYLKNCLVDNFDFLKVSQIINKLEARKDLFC